MGPPRLNCAQRYSDPKSGSLCQTPWAFVGYAGAGWARAEFSPKARRSQLPKAPVWLWEPVNAPVLTAPRGTRSHASAAMQGSSAELMPTFLTLAVLLGEGEGRLRKEDRKGRVFAEMHKMDPLQPDFQSWTFKWHQLSCPCSETQWSQQRVTRGW